MDWAKTSARWVEKHLIFGFDAAYIEGFIVLYIQEGDSLYGHAMID